MEDLAGKVAVVTGAASGIGRAVATRLAAEGLRVVASDIEQPPLDEAVDAITEVGGIAIGVVCDVSDWVSVEALREATEAAFGPADVVMNNAGVAGAGSVADCDLRTWEWTLGVNLWGVIHGLKAFLPTMIERGSGHVVNTSSIAGHLTSSSMGPYNASKHAVAAISETLQQEMVEGDTGVGVTCLCPGFVATNIVGSERNRPERLMGERPGILGGDLDGASSAIADAYAAQMKPELVADQVVDAIRTNRFWLFTDDLADEMIRERHADIEAKRTPGPRAHLIELMFGDDGAGSGDE
jgi:NAD(P)-dependent dehydrogenase (short-subunit alcohol dehydrogenase family)